MHAGEAVKQLELKANERRQAERQEVQRQKSEQRRAIQLLKRLKASHALMQYDMNIY